MIYLQLFWEFFKTGLFSVGGGLATLPFLQEIGQKYQWFTEEELANMIAVGESTPGPIGVNMATYAGIQTAGIPGGIVATLALILPSFLIILMITFLLRRFQENRFVQSCLSVLRPASVGLIGAAVYTVIKVALFRPDTFFIRWPALVLFAVLAILAWRGKKLHPIVLIGMGALAGILLKL